MMQIQNLKMAVINVKRFALQVVLIVNKVFVLIANKASLILNINALKLMISFKIQDVTFHVKNAVVKDLVVQFVQLGLTISIMFVILYVAINYLSLMNNVMMQIQNLKMAVISVKRFALQVVLIVNKVFVLIAMKGFQYLRMTVLKFSITTMILDQGFENINNACRSICGDKLVVAEEQCDDGNLVFEDGCHLCQQTCHCKSCQDSVCVSCPNDQFLYKNFCYNLKENTNLRETSNFSFQDLEITQTFQSTFASHEDSRIQLKILDLIQQVYNEVCQNLESIDKSLPHVHIEIIIQCATNKKIKSQFFKSNYEKGTKLQEIIFFQQCHNSFHHRIAYTFRLKKIVLRDEVLLIRIFENQLKLYALFDQGPQRLLSIELVDI
ncbi:unnamed protein product [Paramecium sonneborni]|uniref:Transmembrane protein n=1 Tax=Paramecium sonneborni TaxID=65129 RepID=A0A8S1RKP6_9CILI|nr:unnamed protein product [Paramecium sonneborni]